MHQHWRPRWLAATEPHRLLLAAILFAALGLRLFGLNWDQGYFLHPDELHIVNTAAIEVSAPWPPNWSNLLDPDRSTLNPRSRDPQTGENYQFAYGTLPLYTTDAVAAGLRAITGANWQSYDNGLNRVGRFLSALFDTATVLVIYCIAIRVTNRRAAIVAATLYATAPAPIQLSHFFTTDAWLTFFVSLTLLFAINAAKVGSLAQFSLAGAAAGWALASKPSVIALVVPLTVAVAVDGWRRCQTGESGRTVALAAIERFLFIAGAGLLAFAMYEPYALANPSVYLDQLVTQSRIVRGTFDVPFTRQYVGTIPILYQADQLLRWGLGPVCGVLSLAGVVWILVRSIRMPSGPLVILGAWLITQGAIVALPETKFLRYAAPLLPAMVVGGGAVADRLLSRLTSSDRHKLAAGGTVAALLGIALWTASYASIYAAPNPRVAASVWIYDNVPPGSRLTAEGWDLAMPVALSAGLSPNEYQYERVEMNLYGDRDPAEVADDLYRSLDRAEYVVIASNRVSSAMPHLPWRYPAQIRYYQLLEDGSLGYDNVGTFRRDPGFGPLRWNDQWADESYLNYDHPEVRIYQKTAFVTRSQFDALMAPALDRPTTPARHEESRSLLLDETVGSLPAVDNGRWSSPLTHHSLAALAVWIVLLAGLRAIGRPFVTALFPRAPDRGAAHGRLVALLLAAYPVWILASGRLVSFSVTWVWISFLAVALLSLLLRRRLDRRLVRRDGSIYAGEIVFWATFALFLLFRWINPDSWHPIWGGEKPMEFAHLNAILRSAHFPPYDPWFAGGYLNYYYYGTYLVAFLVKLTGIPSEIAFNLAQPTVVALIASGAFGVASTLGAAIAGRRFATTAGLLGAVLVTVLGNLSAVVHVISVMPKAITPDFFDWTWGPSREITGGITEFPYFTGLYADLHAHVIAWPLTLLVIALSFEIARDARGALVLASGGSTARRAAPRVLGRIGLLGLVIGSLATTNAWDVPVYVGLAALSCWLATRLVTWWVLRLAITTGMVAGLSVFAFGLFLPFYQHYVALFGSLQETRTSTSLDQFTTHLGGWLSLIVIGMMALLAGLVGERWPRILRDPAVSIAIVIAFAIVGFAPDAFDANVARWAQRVLVLITAGTIVAAFIPLAEELPRRKRLAISAILVGTISVLTAFLLDDEPAFALALAIASLGAFAWLLLRPLAMRFLGLMICAGAAIAAGVELVFLVDDLEPDPVWYRMNTVFKFYNQVWILLALSATVLATYSLSLLRVGREFKDNPEETNGDDDTALRRDLSAAIARRWSIATVATLAAMLVAGILYPLTATKARLDQRFEDHPFPATLDALDWMRYGTIESGAGETITFADDRLAIDWLNDNIEGSPVIAEASIGPYRGNGSRFSIATGLPTILGWERHEEQQRYRDDLPPRAEDVRRLYDDPDRAEKEAILRKYDVQFVIVGDVERLSTLGGERYASPEGISAFDAMIGTVLEEVFRRGDTVIYQVLPP